MEQKKNRFRTDELPAVGFSLLGKKFLNNVGREILYVNGPTSVSARF